MTQADREKIMACLDNVQGFVKGSAGGYEAYDAYKDLDKIRLIVRKDERAAARND